MLQTMDIDYIVNKKQYDIFDFDYNFADITYNGELINKDYIQKEFIDYFLLYQIGYSTLQEFKWRLRRRWKANIDILRQLLELYPRDNLNLDDKNKEKHYTLSSDNLYSDTPNQQLANSITGGYLTDITKFNSTQDNTEKESINAIDKFGKVDQNITDVLYKWFKKFEPLFITDIIPQNLV